MNDGVIIPETFIHTLRPETVKDLVKSKEIFEDVIRTATLSKNNEILERFIVTWDDTRGQYIAHVIKLFQSRPRYTEYGLFVYNAIDMKKEVYLRRLARAQLGITTISGYRSKELITIPALASAA